MLTLFQIVDDDSASLGLFCERKQWIPANHSDMCKFKERDETGYQRVAGGISDLVEDAVEATAATADVSTSVTTDRNPDSGEVLPSVTPRSQMKIKPKFMSNSPGSYENPRAPPSIPQSMMETIGTTSNHSKPETLGADSSSNMLAASYSNNGKRLGSEPEEYNHSERERADIWAAVQSKYSWMLDSDGYNEALVYACYNDSFKIAFLLLERGADIEGTNHNGVTPLFAAAIQGHEFTVRLLLHHGADPDGMGPRSETALICATATDQVSIVQCLLSHHASVDLQGGEGSTALMQAAFRGRIESARVLLEAGADVNAQNYNGKTALMLAIRSKRDHIFAQMLDLLGMFQVDLNALSSSGKTPLLMAIKLEKTKHVELLLEAGADPWVRNKSRRSPLDVAKEIQSEDMIILLERAMSPPRRHSESTPDKSGESQAKGGKSRPFTVSPTNPAPE